MNPLETYLSGLPVEAHREKMKTVFDWIITTYPQLEVAIKWNQPMFIDHGTFIIGFSATKDHMSFTPEEEVIGIFSEAIKKSGYTHTKGLARIKWNEPVDYALLSQMIDYNIRDKADCKTFFRVKIKRE